VEIIDRDQYQRNESFLVRLEEPTLARDESEAEPLGTSLVGMFIAKNARVSL
jgi:hypothetical protein